MTMEADKPGLGYWVVNVYDQGMSKVIYADYFPDYSTAVTRLGTLGMRYIKAAHRIELIWEYGQPTQHA